MRTAAGMAWARSHHRTVVTLKATLVILAAVGVVWAGRTAWAIYEHWGTPSCSWPMRIHGKPTPAQDGLVRCYLRALAHRDSAGLLAVAENIPPVHITKADLAHSADSQSGVATVTFTPNPADSTDVALGIRYADGVRDQLDMTNMIAMGGPSSWRLDIGVSAHSPVQGPPSAAPPTTADSSR